MPNDSFSNRELKIFHDPASLATGVARAFVQTVSALQRSGQTVTDDGVVRVVLTGGTVGIDVLRQVLMLDHAARVSAEDFPVASVDWNRVAVLFGDERFLPTGDPDRNDTQAMSALLSHVGIPRSNVFCYAAPSKDEDPAGPALDAAAAQYAKLIAREAPEGFDLHLLGMGPEGHINSLFPHTGELVDAPSSVVAVRHCPKPPAQRVSLSLTATNSARRVWLVIAGKEKQEAAEHALRGDVTGAWPAGMVAGVEETVLWTDEAAAPRGTDSATV